MNVVRTLIISPFFVMDAVAGIIWRTILLNSSFGWNGYFASLLGVRPFDFFGVHSLLTIIILIVWQWTPFFVLIILAGFQNIPAEIMDSARVDGTGWFKELAFIRLPVIMNHIEVAVLLGLIFVLKVFGLIFVTTRGGPGYSSANLPYYVYKIGFPRLGRRPRRGRCRCDGGHHPPGHHGALPLVPAAHRRRPADGYPRAGTHHRSPVTIVLIWIAAILWCFPLLYMLLTSFKGEADVLPPSLWIAHPTLENYATVLRQEIVRYILDSAVISLTSVAACLSLGVPVAYVVVFGRLE